MPRGMRNSERGDPWPPIRAWLCFQLVCGWFSLLGSSRAPELSMSVLGMFAPWSGVPALYLTASWTCFMDSGFSILSKIGRTVGNIVLICLVLSSTAELTSNEWPESDHREIALEVFICLFILVKISCQKWSLTERPVITPCHSHESCHLDHSQTIFLSVILNAIRFLNNSSCNKKDSS